MCVCFLCLCVGVVIRNKNVHSKPGRLAKLKRAQLAIPEGAHKPKPEWVFEPDPAVILVWSKTEKKASLST